MQVPSLPENESDRLKALIETGLLDTLPEERFDRLTRLAQRMFNVPTALVSLVDHDRQWFKSKQGLDACETHRDISFCGHAILGGNIFEVSNALEDPRFADNPLVTGELQLRFYAGAPIVSHDGYRIGTLCLLDYSPRKLTDDEKQSLRDLADCVRDEIFNRATNVIREGLIAEGPVLAIAWLPTDGWPVTYVSNNAAKILGYAPAELSSPEFRYANLIHPDDLPRVQEEVTAHFASGIETFDQSYRIRLKNGEYRWFYDFAQLVRDERGEVKTIHGYLFDQSELKENEAALKNERRRLAAIIEGTRVGTWEWNIQSGEIVFNERCAEVVGYSLTEMQNGTINKDRKNKAPFR